MSPSPRAKFWSGFRRLFRWFRIGVWLLILFLLGFLVYLNQVGLPEFLKRPLLEELHSHGVDLQFARIRWHWYRGIVAQHVNLGSTAEPAGPQLFVDELDLKFSHSALKKLRFEIESVRIRQGRFVWHLQVPGYPEELLDIDEIQTDLRFLPKDQWQLDRFQASCLGANFRLLGSLTNASALRQSGQTAARSSLDRTNWAAWQNVTRQIVSHVKQLQFAQPPTLVLIANGDALDITRFNAHLGFQVQQAQSPWGALTEFSLNSAFAQPPGSNGVVEARLSLSVRRVKSEQAQVEQLLLESHLYQSFTNPMPLLAQWKLKAGLLESRWGSGTNLELSGEVALAPDNPRLLLDTAEGRADAVKTPQLSFDRATFSASTRHFFSNWIPQSAQVRLDLQAPSNRWGSAEFLKLNVTAASTNFPAGLRMRPDWGFWTNAVPFVVSWDAEVYQLQATNLALNYLSLTGHWDAPRLEIPQLKARLYDGNLAGSAELDVASRALKAQLNTSFDLQRIRPLLRPNSQYWLQQYAWSQAPQITAAAQVVLSAWTNRQPDWRGEVLPTLHLDGHFRINQGAYRTIPVTTAESHFSFSNLVWRLPDLHITRPEGTLDLVYWNDTRNQDYRFDVLSHIDPQATQPLLSAPEQKVLKQFDFGQPPKIEGSVWGRWRARERTAFTGQLWATNLTYRSETTSVVQARLSFTNQVLEATDIHLQRAEQTIQSPRVVYDGHRKLVIISNAVCFMDPLVVARVIGPKTAAALKPYRFHDTPHITVNGAVPVQDASHPDLQFDVAGGPFSFFRFNLPRIHALVHWHDEFLVLTNIETAFYQGRLQGNAAFDFTPKRGAFFHFTAQVSDAELNPLLADLRSRTNRLEGTISGLMEIHRANTMDWQSWNGSGHVRLRSGLIWDIPLFGIFSPVLNSFYPGLGNNRASSGTAMFTITNSVIRSRDLEIRAPPVRLQYDGTVDFEGHLNARVEAILLRDTWLMGRIFSLALYPVTKLFEYKVTGTLAQPKSDPLYGLLPRILLFPLHPVRAVKELFSSDSIPNPPPLSPPPPPKP